MEDLGVFCRLNGEEEIVRYIRAPKSYEESKVFLEQVIAWYKDSPVNWRVAIIDMDTGAVAGMFAIIPVGDTAERQLGYSFLPEYWGHGYATEITEAGIAYIFGELGLDSIAAITEADNKASCKVLLKCGFAPEKEYEQNGRLLYKFGLEKKQDC